MKIRNHFFICVEMTLAGILAYAPQAHAAKFANQFVESELPPQWQCNLEGSEWVCQSSEESKKRDAIIVLAAKLKGDQDSLDQYLAYLKTPKIYTSIQGKQIKSEVKYAKDLPIAGHPWVDSLHLDSEIPGFYTRYLATIKVDIGVLVTYSIAKNKYQQYTQDFENMIQTLKVFRKAGGINAAPTNSNLFANTAIPKNLSEESVFSGTTPQGGSDASGQKKGDGDLPLLPLLIGAGVIGFFIWKRRQSGG